MTDEHVAILREASLGSLAACALAGALAFEICAAEQASGFPHGAPAIAHARQICAKRDLALIILLEERGATTASHQLDSAFRNVLRARGTCAQGDMAAALELYDAATLILTTE